MLVKKYVLVVDEPQGETAREVGALKGGEYEIALVQNLDSALAAIARLERLSLVVVSCRSNSSGYEAFMASVRGLHPNLPVIWVGESGSVVAKFLKPPSASGRRADVDGLKDEATRLLRERFYANDLVQEILLGAEVVLREFGVTTDRSEPYIKSNLTVLGEVNALLSFSGEGLAGYVILSASFDNAQKLHMRFAPGQKEPQLDDLEDLLGEITNRVLGRVKQVFESRALSCKLETPSFIRGTDAYFRSKGSSPSLAVEFGGDEGLLHVEFCIDRMDAKPTISEEDLHFFESGEITFL